MIEAISDKRRRFWLTAGAAGLVAAGAGILVARKPAPAFSPDSVEARLWQLELAGIEGASVALKSFLGKPLLLNFWATWCPPCVEELPLLNRFYTENVSKGWQVLGIAVDQKEPVTRFLAATPLTFGVAMAGLPGLEMSRSLGNLSGGLPFTVVLGSDGRVAHRKMGRITPEDLQSWVSLR